jgi:hypothetical protein
VELGGLEGERSELGELGGPKGERSELGAEGMLNAAADVLLSVVESDSRIDLLTLGSQSVHEMQQASIVCLHHVSLYLNNNDLQVNH